MASKYPYREVFEIDEKEARYNFWMQVLTGDKVDNIQGILGIGDKKAEKVLEGCETEQEMYKAVWDAYFNYHRTELEKAGMYWELEDVVPDRVTRDIKENAQLLFMIRELRNDGSIVHWEAPV